MISRMSAEASGRVGPCLQPLARIVVAARKRQVCGQVHRTLHNIQNVSKISKRTRAGPPAKAKHPLTSQGGYRGVCQRGSSRMTLAYAYRGSSSRQNVRCVARSRIRSHLARLRKENIRLSHFQDAVHGADRFQSGLELVHHQAARAGARRPADACIRANFGAMH